MKSNDRALRAGLGHEFLVAALATFQRLPSIPSDIVIPRDTRRALIARFPFGTYFRVERSTQPSWHTTWADVLIVVKDIIRIVRGLHVRQSIVD